MAITSDGSAPYTSAPALVKIIEGYRNRGLQTPFTLDVLVKAGVSEALAPRTLQALELLELVDADGNPTDTLVGLRKAPESDFIGRFAEFVRGAYAEVFAFTDPREDSRERVRDAFRSYKPIGQQERMVSLFLALCEYAGLIDGKPASVRPPVQRRIRPHAERRPATKDKTAAESKLLVSLSSEAGATPPPPDRHPFVIGLLQSLPEIGSVWPDSKRNDWIKAASAVFNMIYERPPDDSVVRLKLSPGTGGGESD
jgi:uncharacterized protein DUF5343